MCRLMEHVYIRQRAREIGCSTTLFRLWIEAGRRCHWCWQPTIIAKPNARGHRPRNAATVDHLLPKGHLDRHDSENKVLACMHCNCLRHHSPWKPGQWSHLYKTEAKP